jgi:hypothetical protein
MSDTIKSAAASGPPPPAPGKSCGSCTMCCKVYEVPVLSKPANRWCQHCKPGRGCGIWQERPQFCRDFHCRYIVDPNLGPKWRPDICKFVMNYQPNGTFAITCDPGARHAWRQEPYYIALKRMSLQLLEAGITMYVTDGVSKIIVTPDEDVVACAIDEEPNFRIDKVERAGVVIWRVTVEPVASAA